MQNNCIKHFFGVFQKKKWYIVYNYDMYYCSIVQIFHKKQIVLNFPNIRSTTSLANWVMLVNQHALNVICEINIIWNSLTALCKLYYKFNWYILTLKWSANESKIGLEKKRWVIWWLCCFTLIKIAIFIIHFSLSYLK